MSTGPVTSLRPPAWDVVGWDACWGRLAGERRQLEDDKTRVESELAALKSERSKQSAAISSLQAREAQLTSRVDKLSADIDANEAMASRVSKELAELQHQRDFLVDAIELRQTQHDALRSEAERVHADWDARSADLDRRQAALNTRSAELDAGKAELDLQVVAFQTERDAWGVQCWNEQNAIQARETRLAAETMELDRDKTITGCLGKILFPVSLALGALIGGAVVAGINLL